MSSYSQTMRSTNQSLQSITTASPSSEDQISSRTSPQMKSNAPTDENAVFAADEIVRICQENLENPPEEEPEATEVEAEETIEPATEAIPPITTMRTMPKLR